MRGWLLDTNVLSELRRPQPNSQVMAFVAAQPGARLFVSTVTLAEIRFGIELVGDPERRAELGEWLAHTLRPLFENRVAHVTEDILVRWRHVVEAGRKRGHTGSEPDMFIAAAALVEQLVVVSRDVREFVEARVPVLNPWTAVFWYPGRPERTLEALTAGTS
ncbi:MAG: type II toxin-antitoxin system VapC family toxin [Geminicoccaceae bacterium]